MAGVRENGGRVHAVNGDRFKREEELFEAAAYLWGFVGATIIHEPRAHFGVEFLGLDEQSIDTCV